MRSSFWPTVLAGAGAAALTAVAAGRDWATASATVAGVSADAAAKGSDVAPPALALALVALAGWGAVLVVRRTGRRVVSVIGALASVGVLLAVVAASGRATDDAAAMLSGSPDSTDSSLTAWFFLTAVGAALTALAFAVALLRAPAWPEMSAKYDAPGEREPDQTDLWRSLDEGHDPTV